MVTMITQSRFHLASALAAIRACLSLASKGVFISNQEAGDLMEANQALAHLAKSASDNQTTFYNHFPNEDLSNLEGMMASASHAYGYIGGACELEEDGNGYLYLAAIITGCIAMGNFWLKPDEVELRSE
jgi:hypothetical protein